MKIFLLPLIALIVSCNGFKFIYDKPPIIMSLENNTLVIVRGDDISIIKSQLNNVVGSPEDGGEFKLLITSSKTSNNVIIKDNQAVSKIEINHILNYSLQKRDGKCIVLETTISSSSTYSLKSSGYSFGTDLAKEETTGDNVEKNINEFFRTLINNFSNLDCKDED